MNLTVIEHETIIARIYEFRGQKVMLDRDLAGFYGVETKYLKRQVKRNQKRFPEDFCFQLSKNEFDEWRRQNVTSNSSDKMGLRYPPLVFTEYGILTLSSILKSDIAIEVNHKIIKVFVQLRKQIFSNSDFFALKEQVKRIEAEQESLSLQHRIDNKLIADKVTQLSSKVHQLTKVLDEFQDAHLIIKRPGEGENKG